MAEYVTKIRTEKGDMQIDYNALANKPTSLPANGGNADTVGGKHVDYFAAATDVEELRTSFNEVINETINEVTTKLDKTVEQLDEVSTKLDEVSTEELTHVAGVTGNIQTQLDEKAPSVHEHSTDDITNGILPIERGGIGAANGADGLQNLFAAGSTILSSHQYGDSLPAAGVAGRFFLKRLVSE